MKKKNFLISFIAIINLLFIQNVKADMGIPDTVDLDVVVSNISGAEVYSPKTNQTVVIPYDTKLTIRYEHLVDNVWYGNIDYYNEYIDIKMDDVTLLEKNFSLDKATHLNEVQKIYLYEDTDAHLYSGPSKKYDIISDKIPVGTTLYYEYIDRDGLWAYTEYKGVKGWLYIYTYTLGSIYGPSGIAYFNDGNRTLITVKNDSALFSSPNNIDSKPVIENIPIHTELKYEYYTRTHPRNYWYYVEYNGVKGWTNEVGNSQTNKIISLEPSGLTMYTSIDTTSPIDVKIPFNTILNVLYRDEISLGESVYYVDYKGTKGWVTDTEKIGYSTQTQIEIEGLNINVYSSPSKESNILEKILDEKILYPMFYSYDDSQTWYYIEDYVDGKVIKGWISSEDAKIEIKEEEPKNEDIDDLPNHLNDNDKSDSNEKKEQKITSKYMNAFRIMITCIIFAIICALVSLVTILLINKKKTFKENDSKQNDIINNMNEKNTEIGNNPNEVQNENNINNNNNN